MRRLRAQRFLPVQSPVSWFCSAFSPETALFSRFCSGILALWPSTRPLGRLGDTRDPPPCVAMRWPPCTEATAILFWAVLRPCVLLDRPSIQVTGCRSQSAFDRDQSSLNLVQSRQNRIVGVGAATIRHLSDALSHIGHHCGEGGEFGCIRIHRGSLPVNPPERRTATGSVVRC